MNVIWLLFESLGHSVDSHVNSNFLTLILRGSLVLFEHHSGLILIQVSLIEGRRFIWILRSNKVNLRSFLSFIVLLKCSFLEIGNVNASLKELMSIKDQSIDHVNKAVCTTDCH